MGVAPRVALQARLGSGSNPPIIKLTRLIYQAFFDKSMKFGMVIPWTLSDHICCFFQS